MSEYFHGPMAHDLPGREILVPGYNPTEHTIEASPHVATIPDHPELLLRWFAPSSSDTSTEALERAMHTAGAHFTQLEQLSDGAIKVIDHHSFIGPRPQRPNRLSIFSVVPFKDGEQLGPTHPTTDPRGTNIVVGLAHYMQWVHDTEEPFVLTDPFLADEQWLVHRGMPACLVDKDESLTATRYGGLASQASILSDWYRRLQYHASSPSLAEAGRVITKLAQY